MKFTGSKAQLTEIINTVQKAVAVNSVSKILEYIKIDADARGAITFTGNNMNLCINYSGGCEVSEGGIIALNSKMFGDIVRRLPEGIVTVTVNEENRVTKIQCERSEFNIEGLSAEGFPDTPEFDGKHSFTVSQAILKKLIRQTVFAVAASETKPILTGMLIEIENGGLTAVTLDGARLALRKYPVSGTEESFKFVVPGYALKELSKILRDDDSEIKVSVSDKHCLFEFDSYKLTTRLLEGEFIKYKPLLAVKNTLEVTVETRKLAESLERSALLLSEESVQKIKKPVKIRIGFDSVSIDCMTAMGSIHDVIPAELKGGELEIGFNYRYMLEAVKAAEEDRIKLEMSGANASCFIRSTDGSDRYTYIVQPIRIRN